MKRLLILACAVAALSGPALSAPAVLPVVVNTSGQNVSAGAVICVDSVGSLTGCGSPAPVTTTVINSTIATLNTYQSALAANVARKGCLIVNKSAAIMRIYVGAPGSANDAQAQILLAGTVGAADGGSFSCGLSQGAVITDQISIASPTATSAYLVMSQ